MRTQLLIEQDSSEDTDKIEAAIRAPDLVLALKGILQTFEVMQGEYPPNIIKEAVMKLISDLDVMHLVRR